MPLNQQVSDFYYHFSGKLLADYVYGNARIEAAICHALKSIPRGAKRILDVGCGIGWSSWEIKRYFSQASVLGIDISPKMIEIASKLFKVPGLDFLNHNITDWTDLFEPPFDAIIMLDVYEHILKELREKSHLVVSEALNEKGVVVLTYPSIHHQSFLRNCQPGGLQPVDEDITSEDLSKLARDIDAHIVCCNHMNIWKTNDYVHTVIQRNPTANWNANEPSVIKRSHTFDSRHERMKHVCSCLKERIMHDGTILSNHDGPRVCVVSPNKSANSETFIRAHIERLPARVHLLYGDWFPTATEDDKPLCSMFLRGLDLVTHKLLKGHAVQFRERALRNYLRRQGIQAVLAEYGPTGVNAVRACKAEGVPLVVHFHGFDAYDHLILEQYQSAYKRMFAEADAIIVVSRDMERQLLELGVPQKNLFYNAYGVDTSIFSGSNPAASPPVFLAVGRFVDKKAPQLTILAFKKVFEKYPFTRLVMIGDGPLLEACKQMARALGISKTIEFQGARSHIEVAAAMRQARAFVQHSLTTNYGDSEGTPVAILEAGATGLPVVATRHAGINDVVVDKETGFLVDEGDIEGMAEWMLLLAKEPTLASRLGNHARERALTEFSMEQSIHNLSRIIENAILSHKNQRS